MTKRAFCNKGRLWEKRRFILKIGILGGSFSPPHKGHLHAATCARDELKLDKIILIPAGDPPHKNLPCGTPSKHHRLQMARIAAETIGAEVLDIEIRREGKSYTAETLSCLKDESPNDELYFIMGTDMLLTLDKWYKPEVIFEKATICAVARDEGDLAKICEKVPQLSALGAQVQVIKNEAYPASSTEIRDDIAGRKDLLPDGVYEYILRESLYGIRGENN